MKKITRALARRAAYPLTASIETHIFLIRGQKVMVDSDLADQYGVPTKVFNQAVKRNLKRFPKDFMFRLSGKDMGILRSQIVTSSWGGRRSSPYAFTEQGVAMLSSILNSERAVQVNIAIMRLLSSCVKFLRLTGTLQRRSKSWKKSTSSTTSKSIRYSMLSGKCSNRHCLPGDEMDFPIESGH